MARYVLLRIEDDDEADDLLRDVALHPHTPLLTPAVEHAVSVEVVADLDPSDRVSHSDGDAARGLRAVLRQSYARASRLAAERAAAL